MTTAHTVQSCRYSRWDGQLSRSRWTWLMIVCIGVRLAAKRSRTRGLVIAGGLLVLGSCGMFYALSLLETLVGTSQARGLYDFIRVMLGVDVSGVARLEELRGLLWRCVFLLAVHIQMFWVVLMVAQAGPGVIANDLKARALPIYFAKPVTPLTYLVGKWMTVVVFIAMVTLIPNLASLLLGTWMTGGPGTWGEFLVLAGDLLVSGLGLCVVAGAIVIALSSLTSDRRYVTGAWLAICVLLVAAQAVVRDALPADSVRGFLGCISLKDNVLVLTEWLFGMREAWETAALPSEAFIRAPLSEGSPGCAAVVLAGWTVGALLLCYRQVVRFSRSAANV